jgi:thiol-disulfide isomerase/thioredoxin
MSKICQTSEELRNLLNFGRGVFVLFYADWCPFSRAFLPVYEKHSADRNGEFLRVELDGNEALFAEHSVEVYPTVLYFEGSRLSKRLDGKHFVGLREKQLSDLIASCRAPAD